jgi:hypothetical protein
MPPNEYYSDYILTFILGKDFQQACLCSVSYRVKKICAVVELRLHNVLTSVPDELTGPRISQITPGERIFRTQCWMGPKTVLHAVVHRNISAPSGQSLFWAMRPNVIFDMLAPLGERGVPYRCQDIHSTSQFYEKFPSHFGS